MQFNSTNQVVTEKKSNQWVGQFRFILLFPHMYMTLNLLCFSHSKPMNKIARDFLTTWRWYKFLRKFFPPYYISEFSINFIGETDSHQKLSVITRYLHSRWLKFRFNPLAEAEGWNLNFNNLECRKLVTARFPLHPLKMYQWLTSNPYYYI